MITRTSRTAAIVAALLLGLLAIASPAAAQESTPAVVGPPVMVGQTEVGWVGDWQYDAQTSSAQQATLTEFDRASGTIKLATYGEFDDDTVDSPSDALDTFATVFFDGTGAESVVEAGSGELENGAVWKIFTFSLQSLQLTFLATVSEADSGAYVVSTLTGNTDQFPAIVEQVQQEISLDGEPRYFDGIDVEQVTSGLNATPIASPEA